MDATTVCYSCARDANEVDVIACDGFCKSTFHLKCVKLSAEARETIKNCGQIFWMCNACTKMMKNATFRQAISSTNSAIEASYDDHKKVLTELRMEIAQNTSKINSILEQFPTEPPTRQEPQRTQWKSSAPDYSRKRPRIDDEPKTETSAGTRATDPAVIIPLAARPERADLFWLYLSGFDPKATEDNIRELVKRNLNSNEAVDVRKLVPKGKSLDELTFVSFKVGVVSELKDIALSPATWQIGIAFREFDFQTRNEDAKRNVFQFRL